MSARPEPPDPDDPTLPPAETAAADGRRPGSRDERLKAALKANMARRKAQAKARTGATEQKE